MEGDGRGEEEGETEKDRGGMEGRKKKQTGLDHSWGGQVEKQALLKQKVTQTG